MEDTENDIQDRLIAELYDIDDNVNKMKKLAKETYANSETIIYVDENGNDASVIVYDHRNMIWKSSDTFDAIAEKEYGDASYGALLAYYNGIKKEFEIEAGTKIKLPIFTKDKNILENKVYYPPMQKELYGRDIAIDDEGNIKTFGGDFGVISDKLNLAQGLINRLTTAFTRRIRLTSYGIRAGIGEPAVVKSYVLSSVEQTVLADPRVAEVTEINLEGNGDKMTVSVLYIDRNNITGKASGDF